MMEVAPVHRAISGFKTPIPSRVHQSLVFKTYVVNRNIKASLLLLSGTPSRNFRGTIRCFARPAEHGNGTQRGFIKVL